MRRLAPLGVLVIIAAFLVQSGIAQKVYDQAKNQASQPPATVVSAKDLAGARSQLSELAVGPAGSMKGYSRDRFKHWADPDHNGCDAREDTLKRDAKAATNDGCKVVAGRWVDPYSGATVTSAHNLDIDHMVPLANAWRSGADTWSDSRREAFANDPRVLLAVDSGLNRQKGDKGPEAWLPPAKGYRAAYAVHWIAVKSAYNLTVTPAEKKTLAGLIDN